MNTSAIISWLVSFGIAIGKKAAVKALPVVIGIGEDLARTISQLIKCETNSNYSAADKAGFQQDALDVGRTAWLVAKEEGLLLIDDVAALAAQAAGSEIQTALGIS